MSELTKEKEKTWHKHLKNNLWLSVFADDLSAIIGYIGSEQNKKDLQKYDEICITIKYPNKNKILREFIINKDTDINGFAYDLLAVSDLIN